MSELQKEGCGESNDILCTKPQHGVRKIFAARVLPGIACAMLGFLIASQWLSLRFSAEEKFVMNKTYSELTEDYLTLQAKNQMLTERNFALTNTYGELEEIGQDTVKLEKILQEEALQAQRFAGLVSIEGCGIILVIAPDDAYPISSNMLIQMANELKAADASAISVNGQRLVSMSEIRDTVSGFSVNRVSFSYSEPITVAATGNGVDMYGALSMVGGLLDKWSESHIDVKADIVDNLTIPAIAKWQETYMDPDLLSEE